MMAKTSRARGSTEQAVAVLLCKVSSDISLSLNERLAARLDRSASICKGRKNADVHLVPKFKSREIVADKSIDFQPHD